MTPKFYKSAGFEFAVVQRKGDITRAIGRKGKAELHHVTAIIRGITSAGELETVWRFDNEAQAVEKFNKMTK